MKLSIKRFASAMCVFALIVLCGFVMAVPAEAWSSDDMDGTEIFMNDFLSLSAYLTNNITSTKYDDGLWRSSFEFINLDSGERKLFSVGNDGVFTSGHGLLCFYCLPEDFVLNYVTSAKVAVRNNAFSTSFTFSVDDGSLASVSSNVNQIYTDDASGFVFYDNGYVFFLIQGTLAKNADDIILSVDIKDGISDGSVILDYADDNLVNVVMTRDAVSSPVVDGVSVSVETSAPYYPGSDVQLKAEVSGTGIEPGSSESSLYWYVHGNSSENTYIETDAYSDAILHIGNDEIATALEIEAISTFDTTKSDSVTIPVSYPLLGSMIAPSGTHTFVESSKRQEIQFELILPNGDSFNYTDIEWTTQASTGASSYFRIDDQGLLWVEPNAPAGASCTVHFAYGFDTDNVSPAGATVKIVSTQEGIYDNLTPTPEQNDKAEEMEDAIGDAADKLENNNSSLGQLTPTRPQINTNLEFDQEQMLAVSPLVTNIWSINGLGRMISIVLVVATVAYIFFGKRDG